MSILKIRVENMKDASGKMKRVMFSTLIVKKETINAVAELQDGDVLSQEFDSMIEQLLSLQAQSKKSKKIKK